MVSEAVTVRAVYRYPVKGLSPQALERTRLTRGQTIPADRLYAIENGPIGFDPAAPAYFPKQRFLMLMRNERLAALRTEFDEATHTLTIHWQGADAASGDLRTPQGRSAIESFFASPKREWVHDERYATRGEARASIFEDVEGFYDRARRHSALGYVSPV